MRADETAIRLIPIIQMESMVTGMWRRFGAHIFEGKITVEDMTRIEVAGNLWHKQNPGKVVELVIIFPSDARLESDERTRMATLIKRWESVRSASATVVLADGLLGSMHRSVLTGMQMIAPPPHPTKVFGGISAALQWLLPHVQGLCGPEVTHEALLAAVESLCATFKAARAAS